MANDVTRRILIKFDAEVANYEKAIASVEKGLKDQVKGIDGITTAIKNYSTGQRDANGKMIVSQKAVVQMYVETEQQLKKIQEALDVITTAKLGTEFKNNAEVIKIATQSVTEAQKKAAKEEAATVKQSEQEKRAERKKTEQEAKQSAREQEATEKKRIKEIQKAEAEAYREDMQRTRAKREAILSEAAKEANDANQLAQRLQRISQESLNSVQKHVSERLEAQKVFANTSLGIEQKLARDIAREQEALRQKLLQWEFDRVTGRKTNAQFSQAVQVSTNTTVGKIDKLTTAADAAKEALTVRQAQEAQWRMEASSYRAHQREMQQVLEQRLQLDQLALTRNGGRRAVLLQQQANTEANIRRAYAGQIQTYERALQMGFISTAQANQYATAALGNMTSQLQTTRAALEQHLTALGGNEQRTQSLAMRVLEMIGLYRIWSSLINTVVAGLKSIPATGIEMQATQSALHASFSSKADGSMDNAGGEIRTAAAMQMLQAEAERTGINILTLEKNYRSFMASAKMAGESTDTVNKAFKNLNTTITALHMDGSRAELTFLALAQMFNKGKIQSEELVKQLGNLLPGAFATFAAANKKSTQELITEMKKGEVAAHETVARFLEFYATKYGGAFEIASQGVNANVQRLETAWTNFSRSLFVLAEQDIIAITKFSAETLKALTPVEYQIAAVKHEWELFKRGLELPFDLVNLTGLFDFLGEQKDKLDVKTSKPFDGVDISKLSLPGQAKAIADEVEKQGKRIAWAQEQLAGTKPTITARGGSSANPWYAEQKKAIEDLLVVQDDLIKKSAEVQAKLAEAQKDNSVEGQDVGKLINKADKAAAKAMRDETAVRKEILDNRINDLKQAINLEEQLYGDRNRELDKRYKAGLISLQDYAAGAKNLDAEITAKRVTAIREQMSLVQAEIEKQQGNLTSSKAIVAGSKVVSPEMKAQVSAELGQYAEFIKTSAKENGIPEAILFAMMGQESGGNAKAVSGAGAKGLMQLLSGTFEEVMGNQDKLFDPQRNIEAGARYFAKKLAAYKDQNEQFLKALAAYNAGEGNVNKAIAAGELTGKDWKDLLPNETKGYIKQIPARMEKMGISQEDITVATNYTTLVGGTSKAIETLKGKYSELSGELKKVAANQGDYAAKVRETAMAEMSRIHTKYATPDEKAATLSSTVKQLNQGIGDVKLSDIDTQKELLAIEKERVEANQALIDKQNELPESLKNYYELTKKIQESYSSLGTTSFDALNGMFDGISKLITALDSLNTGLAKNADSIQKERDAYSKSMYPDMDGAVYEKMLKNQDKSYKDHIKTQEKLQQNNTVMQVNSIRQVAAISAKFFGEKTVMRKALNVVEQTLSALELAKTIEDNMKKLGLLDLFMAKDAQKTAQSVINSQTESVASQAAGTVKAGEAVANEASGGDPYSAFARAAAMIALMASIGFAVGGGGGGASANIAKDRQAATGTGTVLGDTQAKSESMSKSIERLKDNSDLSMPISQGMLANLIAIKDSISGMTAYLSRSFASGTGGFGISDKAGYSSITGASSMLNTVMGIMGTKKTLADFGITFNSDLYKVEPDKWKAQTYGELMDKNPLRGQSYQDITKKDSIFGITLRTSTSRYRDVESPLDDKLLEQFRKLLVDMGAITIESATGINNDYKANLDKMRDYKFELPDISFKDLKGDEIEAALQTWASQQGDKMATYLSESIGLGVADFQKAGEGELETLIRVANGMEKADVSLWKYGLTIDKVANIQNKQGDVALELWKMSVLSIEDVQKGIGKIIKEFDGTTDDAVALYDSLLEIRQGLSAGKINTNDISYKTIQGAGNLDKLVEGSSVFKELNLSAMEKFRTNAKLLSDEFIRNGTVIPTTIEQYIDLVRSIDTTTESGQKLQGSLIALAPRVSDLNDQYYETMDTVDQLRQSHEDYAVQLAEAGMNLNDIPGALTLVSEQFDKLAPAMDALTIAAKAFLTEADQSKGVSSFWQGAAEAAITSSPFLQGLGVKANATFSDLEKLAAKFGITDFMAKYGEYTTGNAIAGQNIKNDPIVQYITAIAQKDSAKGTTAQDLAKDAEKSNKDNGQTAIDNAKKFAEVQKTVTDAIDNFAGSDANKKIMAVNKEIQGLIDSVSGLSDTALVGIETLRALKLGMVNKELFDSMKPVLELTNKLGITNLDLATAITKDEKGLWSFSKAALDLIPSLSKVTDNIDLFKNGLTALSEAGTTIEQNNLSDSAKRVSDLIASSKKQSDDIISMLKANYGEGSPQFLAYASSAQSTVKEATGIKAVEIFKPLTDELGKIGFTEAATALSDLNTEMGGWRQALQLWSDSVGLSSEAFAFYSKQLDKVEAERRAAILKQKNDTIADITTQYSRLRSSDFEKQLFTISDNYVNSIKSAAEGGATYEELLQVAATGVKEAGYVLSQAQKTLKETFDAIYRTIKDKRDSISDKIMELNKDPALEKIQYERYLIDLQSKDFDIQMSAIEKIQSLRLTQYEREISFIQTIKNITDSLKVDDNLSPFTAKQRMDEAGRQFNSTLTAAKGGDQTAIGELSSKTSEYLTEARSYFAGNADYAKIFKDVTDALDAMGVNSTMTPEERTAKATADTVKELQKLQIQLETIQKQQETKQGEENQKLFDSYSRVGQQFLAAIQDLSDTLLGEGVKDVTFDLSSLIISESAKQSLDDLIASITTFINTGTIQDPGNRQEIIDAEKTLITHIATLITQDKLTPAQTQELLNAQTGLVGNLKTLIEGKWITETDATEVFKAQTALLGNLSTLVTKNQITSDLAVEIYKSQTDLVGGLSKLITDNLIDATSAKIIYKAQTDLVNDFALRVSQNKMEASEYESIYRESKKLLQNLNDAINGGQFTPEQAGQLVTSVGTLYDSINTAVQNGTLDSKVVDDILFDSRNLQQKVVDILYNGQSGLTGDNATAVITESNGLRTSIITALDNGTITAAQAIEINDKAFGEGGFFPNFITALKSGTIDDPAVQQIITDYGTFKGGFTWAFGEANKQLKEQTFADTPIGKVQTGINKLADNMNSGLSNIEWLKEPGTTVETGIKNLATNIETGLTGITISTGGISGAISGLMASIAGSISSMVSSAQTQIDNLEPTPTNPTGTSGGGGYPTAWVDLPVPINGRAAVGGIYSSPIIAAEAGPEAIIPLPGGRTVPVTITNNNTNENTQREVVAAIIASAKLNAQGQEEMRKELMQAKEEIAVLNRKLTKIASE